MTLHPIYISGQVRLSDGSQTSFCIAPDLGWQQWGNLPSNLGATVDLIDALSEAAAELLTDSEGENE